MISEDKAVKNTFVDASGNVLEVKHEKKLDAKYIQQAINDRETERHKDRERQTETDRQTQTKMKALASTGLIAQRLTSGRPNR